jgi:hypothetical protein
MDCLTPYRQYTVLYNYKKYLKHCFGIRPLCSSQRDFKKQLYVNIDTKVCGFIYAYVLYNATIFYSIKEKETNFKRFQL